MSPIKKRIAVVTLDYMAAKFYENQIKELFGELVVTCAYNLLNGSAKRIKEVKVELERNFSHMLCITNQSVITILLLQ